MKNEIDRLLDAALAGYSRQAPPLGLEQRVLNHVRLAETRRRRFMAGWALAAVALASALLIVVTRPTKPAPHAQRPVEVSRMAEAPLVQRPIPPARHRRRA